MIITNYSKEQPVPAEQASTFWFIQELVSETFKYLDTSDLISLCLVSHSVNAVAVELLYKEILLEVKISLDYSSTPLYLLHQTLTVKPELASHIKTLRVLCFKEDRETYRILIIGGMTFIQLLVGVIKSCSQLRSLGIADVDSLCMPQRETFDDLNIPLPEHLKMENVLEAVPSLRHFEFVSWAIFWPAPDQFSPPHRDFMSHTLAKILSFNDIRTAVLTLREGPTGCLSSPLPICNSLTGLELRFASISLDALRNIITSTPNIRNLALKLRFHVDTRNPRPSDRLDSGELGQILRMRCSTLSYLKIDIDFKPTLEELTIGAQAGGGGNKGLFGPFGSIGSLKSFPMLKLLDITPELLLGWENHEHGSGIPLEHLLPDSLLVLKLSWDFYDWDFSPWHAIPFLKEIDSYFQRTKSTQLRYFGLRALSKELGVEELDYGDLTHTIRSESKRLGIEFEMEYLKFDQDYAYDPSDSYWC
jgi:hypothetical protein